MPALYVHEAKTSASMFLISGFMNELAITWFIIQTREAKMGADMHKFNTKDNV